MIRSRAGCVKDAYGAGSAGRAPARSQTRPARSQNPAAIRGQGADSRTPKTRPTTGPNLLKRTLAVTDRYR